MSKPCNQCNNPCDSDLEVQELAELPIDNLASTPDYFLTEREVIDPTTGKAYHSITRTPGKRILGNGINANAFTLDPVIEGWEVEEGQPIPAYVQNENTQNTVRKADASHPAQFLVTGKIGDLLVCQSTGRLSVLNGHNYIVGAQYYLGSDGTPTTSASQTGQKLFVAVSNIDILINL